MWFTLGLPRYPNHIYELILVPSLTQNHQLPSVPTPLLNFSWKKNLQILLPLTARLSPLTHHLSTIGYHRRYTPEALFLKPGYKPNAGKVMGSSSLPFLEPPILSSSLNIKLVRALLVSLKLPQMMFEPIIPPVSQDLEVQYPPLCDQIWLPLVQSYLLLAVLSIQM